MRRGFLFLAIFAGCCPPEPTKTATTANAPKHVEERELALPDEQHLRHMHQLTFGADNAEAYWSFSGDRLIFQTNRPPYKCDQIEMMPATGGPSKLISTGKGRTTCSYFLKGDQEIVYASTHEAGPDCPTPPDMSKGYNWGLFEYDIYRANADGTNLRRLTDTPGYDAEATVCPVDGSILFTSVRSGDAELWRMDADGKNPRQLTSTLGYDGGAVWSPDCTKIAWRASRPTAPKDIEEYKALLAQKLVKPIKMDLWVGNADGSEARQITYMPGASFGPAFTPDGKRLIFSSNFMAPRGPEFDLFLIDLDGEHLERVTFAPSFDGFPMFSPDGKKLSFSSNRRDVEGPNYRVTGTPAGEHDTNVFVADWVEHVDKPAYMPESASAERFMTDVRYLADDAREGRGIGTKGLADATAYVEHAFQAAGADVSRQKFDVTTSIERGAATALAIDGKAAAADAFAPMGFSASKTVDAPLVLAGWGTSEADYKDAKGKIAVVHRFAPPDIKDPAEASKLGDLRFKAFTARGKGAVALIVVDDGDPKQEEAALPSLAPSGTGDANVIGSAGDAGIPIVVAKRTAIPKGAKKAKLAVALEPLRAPTENVIGVFHAAASDKLPGVLVIGAHVDHLGEGGPNALDKDKGAAIHNGADDNASGVGALLEVARDIGAHKSELKRDVYVIAFSGEEEGDLGSTYFTSHQMPPVYAMLNMDMVGRMRGDSLMVNGGATAKEWQELVAPICTTARVQCTVGGTGYGPSDHMPFYIAGAPVLFFFTGSHLDYHTAGDDADKINGAGGARVASVVGELARKLAARGEALTYVKAPPEQSGGDVRHVGASLGTVPSYDDDPNQPPGMVVSDVVPEGPAAKAGLKAGDRIVQIGTIEIRNVHDLMFVLQTAKPGTDTQIVFVRGGKRMTATATFGVPRGRR
jgi:Tol biopolymer transport system component